MRIIRERSYHEVTYHRLQFEWADMPGAGFSFACDPAGRVDESDLRNPDALANYRACLAGERDGRKIVALGVASWDKYWNEPAIGECDCGGQVELEGFTCTCPKCGADYNSCGQRLAPRECWGEETGEHWSDVARIR